MIPPVDAAPSARQVIDLLGLARHPEGGYFRETWRDAPDGGDRGSGTAIYYLLPAGETSHWHRVDAMEVWHWYAGAPLALSLAADAGTEPAVSVLGPDLGAGQRPQILVPAGTWQAAVSLGAWTLVGCTVSPAFVFEGFEMAPPGWRPGSP